MDNISNEKICQICKQEFTDKVLLHKHIKTHGHRIVSYYQSCFPKYDLYDNKIIAFKSEEQYFNSDFNNKNHLRFWLRKQNKETAQKYCKNLLERRIKLKKLNFAPCQVELRSLLIPSINYYDELFGDYYLFCKNELNISSKYERIEISNILNPNDVIQIDTREQTPLIFKNLQSVKLALKFGDYTLNDKDVCQNSFIERKSLADFYGTMSGGIERFKRELLKAKDAEAEILVLIESDFNNVARFKYLRAAYSKVRASPDFVLHNMREIINQFPFVQFLFVDGREEAARIVEIILTCKGLWKKADLQLLYDTDKL